MSFVGPGAWSLYHVGPNRCIMIVTEGLAVNDRFCGVFRLEVRGVQVLCLCTKKSNSYASPRVEKTLQDRKFIVVNSKE